MTESHLTRLLLGNPSTNVLRDFFNEWFWRGKPVKPEWNDLKIALLREDAAQVEILVQWGAAATRSDLLELRLIRPLRFDACIAMLRRAGLKPDVPADGPGERNPFAIIKAFIDGAFVDHRIGQLPAEWRKVLKVFQMCGAPESVIAGGALRDLFQGKTPRDVDIFLLDRGNNAKDIRFIEYVFKGSGLDAELRRGPDPYDLYRPSKLMFQHEIIHAGQKFVSSYSVAKSWTLHAGPQHTEYNVIFVTGDFLSAGRGPLTAGQRLINSFNLTNPAQGAEKPVIVKRLLDAFDFGFCGIACDGGQIVTTRDYERDVAGRRIHLVNGNSSKQRLEKLMSKYPDWVLSETAKNLLKPDMPLPPPNLPKPSA